MESKHQRTLSNQQRRREERLAGEEDCDRLHLLGDFGIQPDEDAAVSNAAKNAVVDAKRRGGSFAMAFGG